MPKNRSSSAFLVNRAILYNFRTCRRAGFNRIVNGIKSSSEVGIKKMAIKT